MNGLKPNLAEKQFLRIGYQRFFDLYTEIETKAFWRKSAQYRFHCIRDIFAIYNELICCQELNQMPVKQKKIHPAVSDKLFRFVRHLLAHFPFFTTWDSVWINKELATWSQRGQIDKYLEEVDGQHPVTLQFRDPMRPKQNINVAINFPADYALNKSVYLKDILSEHEGVRFSIGRMLLTLLQISNAAELLMNPGS